MKITVKNFGPIREAKDIEISPMTLFVGPSNTGKSYLAILIYSIFNALKTVAPIDQFKQGETNQQKIKRYNNNIEKFIDAPLDSPERPKTTEYLAKPASLMWASHIKKRIKNQILYCFGEEGSKLLQNKEMSIVLSSDDNEIVVNILSPSENKISNNIKKMIFSELYNFFKRTEISDPTKKKTKDLEHCQMLLNSLFADHCTFSLLGNNHIAYNCHYLPAIRGGIMQSHRALVDTLIQQAPMAGLTKIRSTPMFNGVLANFMRNLIRLRENEEPSKIYSHPKTYSRANNEKEIISIGTNMESGLMQGKIEIQMTEMGYPDFHYKFKQGNKVHDLSLMNTSSMVSELAPISLFIRHYLKQGSIFIVEEPEAHLHPEGQRAIADILVQLANAGVFVLATTHSDIILEQISNSVLASKLKPAKLKALDNHPTPLNESDSASYSFAERVKGATKVKKIDFDSMTGVITQDHLNVSSDIYNESVSLLEGQEDD